MSAPDVRVEPRELEIRLGNLLRIGVTMAAGVVVTGGIIYLYRHGYEVSGYHDFRGEPAALRTFSGILSESAQFHGRGIMQLGLLVLIATPIARVAFAAYGFARQRDWMYAGISTLVLLLLLYGLLVSK